MYDFSLNVVLTVQFKMHLLDSSEICPCGRIRLVISILEKVPLDREKSWVGNCYQHLVILVIMISVLPA